MDTPSATLRLPGTASNRPVITTTTRNVSGGKLCTRLRAYPAVDSRLTRLAAELPPLKSSWLCANCGCAAIARYGGCLAIGYCSALCQRANWTKHRVWCQLYRRVVERAASGGMGKPVAGSLMGFCAVCGNPRSRICGHCITFYCSVACQVRTAASKLRQLPSAQSSTRRAHASLWRAARRRARALAVPRARFHGRARRPRRQVHRAVSRLP